MVDVAKVFTDPIENALRENTAMAEQPIHQQNMQQANQLNQLSIQQKQRQVQQEQQFQSTMRQMPQNLSPMEQLSYISIAAAKTGDFNAVDKALDAQGRYTGSISLVAEQLNFSDPNNTCGFSPTLFICQQLGNQTTTGFRTSLARDTRDYYLDPR